MDECTLPFPPWFSARCYYDYYQPTGIVFTEIGAHALLLILRMLLALLLSLKTHDLFCSCAMCLAGGRGAS